MLKINEDWVESEIVGNQWDARGFGGVARLDLRYRVCECGATLRMKVTRFERFSHWLRCKRGRSISRKFQSMVRRTDST